MVRVHSRCVGSSTAGKKVKEQLEQYTRSTGTHVQRWNFRLLKYSSCYDCSYFWCPL